MRQGERSVTIQGRELAAALLFAGAELVQKEKMCVLVGDIESRRWHFRPTTNRGVPVKKLVAAYEQERSRQEGDWTPQHVEALNKLTDEELFAAGMMALEWLGVVEKAEKERRGDICVAPTPRSRLVLGPGLSKEKEEVLLRRAGV